MKRTAWTIALCVGVLLALTIGVLAQGDGNLLTNGGFEPPYTERASRVIVANGWEWAYWDRYMPLEVDGGSSGPIIRPEFKEAPAKVDPDRVIEGKSSQCWFYSFAVGDAVVYQTVPAVKGQRYQADGSAESWVTNNSNLTDADGEMYFAVGIDPYGGTVAWRTGVIWSPLTWSGHDHRRIYSPIVQAQADKITVFYRAVSKWAFRNNDAYWDDAHLVQVTASDCPTPQPLPTYTPYPLPTPYPTYTPTGGTPEPCPGTCPGITEIRAAIREEVSNLIFGVVGGK